MKKAVFWSIPGVIDDIQTRVVVCRQTGEAYNWTVEDMSKKYGVDPMLVKIHLVIDVID